MKRTGNKRNRLSLSLILAGLFVLVSAAAFELYRYPWAAVFGGSQDDSALPDPPPIVWSGGDREASAPESMSSLPSSSAAVLPGDESREETRPAGYVELGIIKIPKLGLSQHVLEGTRKQLRYGVGHVTGTASVGAAGNCALAGHNTTSFRYLGKLSAGDRVILKAGGKTFAYSVFRSFTVLPTDIYVLNPLPDENATLTLITCTPYLTATHRLIVQARLMDGPAPSSSPEAGYRETSDRAPSDSAATPPAPVGGPAD